MPVFLPPPTYTPLAAQNPLAVHQSAADRTTAPSKSTVMRAASAVVTSAGLDCHLSDARLVSAQTDPKTAATSIYYELACARAEGYFVVVSVKPGSAEAYTCLEVLAGKGDKCTLPENADPKAGLAALVAQGEPSCQMTAARALGHNDRATVLEVACQGGAGYIIEASYPLSLSKPATFSPCAGVPAGQQIQCELTDPATTAAYLDGLIAKGGKPCDLSKARYAGASDQGIAYFEAACSDGKGYMLQVASNGAVTSTDCAAADNIGDGCKLTDATETPNSVYSKLAHAAGFACDVSQLGQVPANVPDHRVVELMCSNRPDGAIAIVPASLSGEARIENCAISELAGYRCTLTKPEAAYPRLTDDLRKLGKSTCVVSGASVLGVTADTGYVEVACAGGAPGYVMSYAMDNLALRNAIACSSAKRIGGGCKLPQNNRRS